MIKPFDGKERRYSSPRGRAASGSGGKVSEAFEGEGVAG